MKVGLFFGSFNPIHTGHLILAQAARDMAGLNQIWFVVSPGSPDKDYSKLLHEFDRLDLVREAIRDNPDFRASDVEFSLPKPSYTYLTLRKLKEKFPEHQFFILMGADNYRNLGRWKNVEEIRQQVRFIVYPRHGAEENPEREDNELVQWIEAPLLEISATQVRSMIKKGLSVRYLIPEDARKLIESKGFYRD
jgi:nicotinate-nucleotide adenylyltransferase